MIGWAFDGFPIYGPHGPGGDLIYPCSHLSANNASCLDECGGTGQYEIDGFLYHYHLVGPLGDMESEPCSPLPDSSMQPYTIGCFKGVVYDWSILSGSGNGASCESNGYKSTYTASATEGVTAIYGLTTTGSPMLSTSSPTHSPTYKPTVVAGTPTHEPTSEPSVAPTFALNTTEDEDVTTDLVDESLSKGVSIGATWRWAALLMSGWWMSIW